MKAEIVVATIGAISTIVVAVLTLPRVQNWRQKIRTIPAYRQMVIDISQSCDVAIVETDKEGHITYWNPGAYRLFGYRAADTVGKDLSFMMSREDYELHVSRYQQVMERGYSSVRNAQRTSRHADGHELEVLIDIHIYELPDVGKTMLALMRQA